MQRRSVQQVPMNKVTGRDNKMYRITDSFNLEDDKTYFDKYNIMEMITSESTIASQKASRLRAQRSVKKILQKASQELRIPKISDQLDPSETESGDEIEYLVKPPSFRNKAAVLDKSVPGLSKALYGELDQGSGSLEERILQGSFKA